MNQKGLSLQQAANYIGEEFQSLFTQFRMDKAVIPSFGPTTDADVRSYIAGMEDWIIGNLRYSMESRRYFGKKRMKVEKTLIVELDFPDENTSSQRA